MSKVISVLVTFSKEDWTAFRKYLKKQESADRDIFSLYSYLMRAMMRDSFVWDSKEVHQRICPSITHKSFLNLLSLLERHIQDWIVARHIREHDIVRRLVILRSYLSRGLYTLASRMYDDLKVQINSLDHTSLYYAELQFRLYHSMYFSDHDIKYDREEMLIEKLQNSHLRLDAINRGLIDIEGYNMSNILNEPRLARLQSSKIEFADSIINLLQKTIIEEDITAFTKLKEAILTKKEVSKDIMHVASYMYLLSASHKLWQKGKLDALNNLYDIYEHGLQYELLMTDGKIPQRRFHNMIALLAEYIEYDQCLSFIESWYTHIDSSHQDKHKNLAMAILCLYNEEYDQIIDYTRSLKFKDQDVQLRLYCIHAIAQLERGQYHLVDGTLSNFRSFLLRNKVRVSAQSLERFTNFISIMRCFMTKEKDVLKEILESKNMVFRSYAIQKADRLFK